MASTAAASLWRLVPSRLLLAVGVLVGGASLEDWDATATAEGDGKDPCDLHMAPDLGWLQPYIKVGFFTDYRAEAERFYQYNETSYAFLWFNSIAFANLDFVREACPPAARLALLIRAEERLPMREAEQPLLEYGAAAAEATPGDGSDWPLARGVARLRGLTAKLVVPAEYTVDVVMPYCNEPLDDLLSRSTGYDDDWLSAPLPLAHVNLILYRLEVCAPAAGAHVLPPRAEAVARQCRSVEVVPVDASPQAWEAARYLMHLATRYDTLADFTLFLHPDVLEHANPRTLRNVLQSLRVGTFAQSGHSRESADGDGAWYGYLSLSHHYITRPSRAHTASSNCTDKELAFRDLLGAVFRPDADGEPELSSSSRSDSSVQAELDDFGFYCCSQFLVHRDRVRRRPRSWYLRVADSVPWEHCATSYMELLWHGIFNDGRLHEEKRQQRTDLPLFMRVDNFIEATADGLV